MARFQRRDDPLGPAETMEALERLVVGNRDVARPADVLEPGMLRADAGVIESSRDRVRLDYLAPFILQDIGARAVENALASRDERGGVRAGIESVSAGFDADQLDALITGKRVKDADRVRAAADAGDHGVREPPDPLEHLPARLPANHRLQISDADRVRVHSGGRAEDVEGGADVGDPVADRLVDRILERLRAG